MPQFINREDLLESETRTLPSGNTFTRHRCKVCHRYWDTDHSNGRRDELEIHYLNCPVHPSKAKTVS